MSGVAGDDAGPQLGGPVFDERIPVNPRPIVRGVSLVFWILRFGFGVLIISQMWSLWPHPQSTRLTPTHNTTDTDTASPKGRVVVLDAGTDAIQLLDTHLRLWSSEA
jgi:hypothetical protein